MKKILLRVVDDDGGIPTVDSEEEFCCLSKLRKWILAANINDRTNINVCKKCKNPIRGTNTEDAGKFRHKCKLCGEKFRCGTNAINHAKKHGVLGKLLRYGQWKKFFIDLIEEEKTNKKRIKKEKVNTIDDER